MGDFKILRHDNFFIKLIWNINISILMRSDAQMTVNIYTANSSNVTFNIVTYVKWIYNIMEINYIKVYFKVHYIYYEGQEMCLP